MFGQFTIKASLASALLLGLSACTTPVLITLGVVNSADTIIEGSGETYCSDELRATLVWGSELEETAAAPGESSGATIYSGRGDVTVEAWCVRDGDEVGYARVRRGVSHAPSPQIFIFPPAESGELLDDTSCETPDTNRGVPLCIDSELF